MTDDNIFNIDLSWMHNPQLYDKISQDVTDRYNKDKKSSELKSIQTFLDKITNEFIKNKQDALKEFKTIKNNVKSEDLKDIINNLELAIFGYGYYDDEESKYEENVAEITKMRRQKDTSRTFAPPDPDSDDSNEWVIYDKKGFDSNGYNINGIDRDGYDKDGYNINGFDKNGYGKDGYNINGYDFSDLDRNGYNINGVEGVYVYKDKYAYSQYGFNKYGFNKKGYNRKGYNKYGFDRDGYNKYGYNKYGFNRNGFNEYGFNEYGFNRNGLNENRLNKYRKKNIPGSGLKILIPEQMFARLPIPLAQIKAGNNSLELKNETRQLLYPLYSSKQVSKTVYKNLIATI